VTDTRSLPSADSADGCRL